jgi:hypothetical protein
MKKIYTDDFRSMDNYWVEGGEDAWVSGNRLYQKANPPQKDGDIVSTIWCKTHFPENVEIRVKACVIESVIGANNINLFLSYTDPSGKSLFETRDKRKDGDYPRYHTLSGYIFTFVRDWLLMQNDKEIEKDAAVRYRMRRCPGFHLMAERFSGQNDTGVVYQLVIRKFNGTLSFSVDGETILEATDSKPLAGGYLGFRTYRTFLWWSDLEVYEL